MNTISAPPAASGRVVDSVEVTIDWQAEPVNWDNAVARFLLNTVRRSAQPTNIPPLVEDGVLLGTAAGAASSFAPMD